MPAGQDDGAQPRDEGHHAQDPAPAEASPTGRGRLRLWMLVAAAATAALIVLVILRATAPAGVSGSAGTSRQADLGGPFQMVDQEGRPVDQHLLDGKWSAVFFGYVSCPDVCPTTLQTLAAAQRRLGADAAKVQVVFVSVDPDRDGPTQLKVYLDQPDFPPHAVGLTGTPLQVARITKAYAVYSAKRPRKDGGYDMDHSAAIYLMNPKGRFDRPLSETQGPQGLADQIRQAMRRG